jgi:hypothetical protein
VTDFSLLVVVRLLFTLSLLLCGDALSVLLSLCMNVYLLSLRVCICFRCAEERETRGERMRKKKSSSPTEKKKVEKYTRERDQKKKKNLHNIKPTKHTSVPTSITFTKNDTHEEIQRDLSSLSLRNDALLLLREQPPKRDGGVRVSYFW